MLVPTYLRADFYIGRGYIAGTVSVAGIPAARRVVLRHRRSGVALATVFSAADGTYRFDLLDPAHEYDAHASDWARGYKDYIEPALVPSL